MAALLVCMSSYHHTGVCGGGINCMYVQLSSYRSVWWGHYLYVCPVIIIWECVVGALLVCMSSYHHIGVCGGGITCMYVQLSSCRSVWWGNYFYVCPVIIIRECVV